MNFIDFFKIEIAKKEQLGKKKTATNYKSTLKSFTEFLRSKKQINKIELNQITYELLSDYEIYLTNERNISRNSSSFYFRQIRAVYKRACAESETYTTDPFSKIYTGVDKTIKRALDLETLRKVIEFLPKNKHLEFSKDIFIFCFFARGMSFIDFAKLKKQNISNGRINYYRSKTQRLISIKIEPPMQAIINKYQQKDTDYIFPIFQGNIQEERIYNNALRLYNLHLNQIGKAIRKDIHLTSYVARHSWATIARAENVPIEIISESLGHSNQQTTSIYIKSLNNIVADSANKKIINKLKKEKKLKKNNTNYAYCFYQDFYISTREEQIDFTYTLEY